jgi:hypothetical protein
MADAGHRETHAPQPVHVSAAIVIVEPPPIRGRKRMASVSHAASQARHITPCISMQSLEAVARLDHAASRGDGSKHDTAHASAQAPQNVQPPRAKSMTGRRPRPATRID